MLCPKCEKELTSGFLFCPECGASIESDSVEKSDESESVEKMPDSEESDVKDGDKNILTLHDSEDTGRILNETVIKIEPEIENAFNNGELLQKDSIIEPTIFQDSNDSAKTESAEFIEKQEMVNESPVIVQGIPAGSHTSEKTPEITINQVVEKPISTAGVFISFIFYAIPFIGLICLIISAFSGQKKSRKSLARAILIYRCIFLSVLSILIIWAYIFNRDLLFSWFSGETWTQLFDVIRSSLFT